MLKAFLFYTAARLTAFIMRIRDTYPRGDKFKNSELESWEVELEDFLWFDAFFPQLY